MTNRSLWTSFLLVRNESWHRGNVVLLGDAAHTAHFSIGSGTKLAMEDAIALAQAFLRHPRDLERALVDYELERQPVVERFQQAAGESAAYFSRVEHYAHMDPMPFAFNLLTRSGRITHANLAQRDPQFVRVLDAWFHGGGPGAVAPPPLFAPWRGLRNRIVRAAAEPERLEEMARSGAGLVLAGPVAVTPDGRISPDTPTLDGEWGEAVDEVHASRRPRGRAAHPRRASRLDSPPRPRRRPAAQRGRLAAASRPRRSPTRRACRRRGRWTATRWAACAKRSPTRPAAPPAAGFDVLELDMGHGYLLASFLSPESNRRDDEYGGDLAGRLRFPLQVLDAVREAWPEERLLAVRLNVMDGTRHGLKLPDGIAIARELAEHGCGLVHVRGRADGARGSPGRLPPRVPHPARRPRARRGARADPRRRLPDDARRGEHDPRRRPRRPVPARRARHRSRAPGPRRAEPATAVAVA